jgi:hypothetical protein
MHEIQCTIYEVILLVVRALRAKKRKFEKKRLVRRSELCEIFYDVIDIIGERYVCINIINFFEGPHFEAC